MKTTIGVNDPKAVKKYSAFLAKDVNRKSYFTKKYMGGEDSSMPIHRLMELENDAGEYISFDLSVQMSMQPIEGDAVLEGKEKELKFYTDGLYIDQMRGGVNSGGRMTRKRTVHDLRKIGRNRQSDWWSRVFDELFFMYLSGARGINDEYNFPTTYTGFANNAISAPDSEHHLFAGSTTKATLASTDKFTLDLLDRAKAYASMMGGAEDKTPKIMPIMIDGEKHYVCVMNPWQSYDLRKSTASGDWLDIQKAIATSVGKDSNIMKGGLGMHNGVVLHEHESIVRFNDYGAGGAVEAARSLFLGEQAGVIAFGSPGTGLRFSWNEEKRDNGNQLIITTSTICGVKKTTFNGKDYGVMALDSAAAKP